MKKKHLVIFLAIFIMSTLISNIVIGLIQLDSYSSSLYQFLAGLTALIITRYPDLEQDIGSLIKENVLLQEQGYTVDDSILNTYGFTPNTFAAIHRGKTVFTVTITLSLFLILLLILYLYLRRINRKRINELTSYLEKINFSGDASILPRKEDDFALLEDEIYKTVTKLKLTEQFAVKEHKKLADNLADISHQIKTPISSISLMTQLLDSPENHKYIERIRRQTVHLEQLVKALLTLSRINAGALIPEKRQVDIYTVLQLALDTLEDAINEKEIQVILPNHPDVCYEGDMDWSMEAFSNLIKNCIDYVPYKGIIRMEYSRNPLYVQLQIEDNGKGFSDKDIPHLFERFYRGEHSSPDGTGIGLSLAKAIIEMQNGVISAKNLPEGGACFIVRFYYH